MKSIGEVLKGTTLNKKENSTSNYFDNVIYKTDVCDCGKEYDAAYTTVIPDGKGGKKVSGIMSEKCFECEQEINIQNIMKESAIKRKKERQKKIEEQFNDKSLINDKLKQATFDSYDPTNEELNKAKSLCQRYANNFNKDNPVGLLLIGNYGTGKSHLTVAISKYLISEGHSALFISTPKLLSLLRSTYNKNSIESEEEVMRRLIRVDCLVLDDIGSEQTKKRYDDNEQDWATSKIFEVIDSRIGKHTIYTSNFNPTELQDRLGGRNFSRMMEGIHVIKMNGDDYRLRDFK